MMPSSPRPKHPRSPRSGWLHPDRGARLRGHPDHHGWGVRGCLRRGLQDPRTPGQRRSPGGEQRPDGLRAAALPGRLAGFLRLHPSPASPSGSIRTLRQLQSVVLDAHAQTECSGPLTWNGLEGVPILCAGLDPSSADPSGNSCQVAVYGRGHQHQPGSTARSTRSHADSPTFASKGGQAITGSSQPHVSVTLSAPTNGGGTWISTLPVTVTTSDLSNPPTGTFILRPLVQDPAALASATGYPQC